MTSTTTAEPAHKNFLGFHLRDIDNSTVRALLERFANATCQCIGAPLKVIDTKLFGDGDASMMCQCPVCNRIHMYGCHIADGQMNFMKVN
ncbi:MAG: hypothetical protein NC102_04205 [Clostridium sp.]|nr:hypothetical protein [Clostridium sp.]